MHTEEQLIQQVELLEGIINSQRRILDVNNELIALKNRMIELCEHETSIYKKEAKMLGIACIIAFIIILGLCITVVATS